jgi:hypothetical protein
MPPAPLAVTPSPVAAAAPAAGNARPTLTARRPGLASYTADIAAAILGGPFRPRTRLAAAHHRRTGG